MRTSCTCLLWKRSITLITLASLQRPTVMVASAVHVVKILLCRYRITAELAERSWAVLLGLEGEVVEKRTRNSNGKF